MSVLIEKPVIMTNFQKVRSQTVDLCLPLEIEDYQIQPMADASPPKWHLAHVTWFFETFVLAKYSRNHKALNPVYNYLFNSYYNGVGSPYPRASRGHLSRPTVAEIYEYRKIIDERVLDLLETNSDPEIAFRVNLGLHHERQHQELMLTDVKYNFGNNPLLPSYSPKIENNIGQVLPQKWIEFKGGIAEVGASYSNDFIFDNETPRHKVFLAPFYFSSHLETNRDFLEFIQNDGYERHDLWLSDGWAHLKSLGQNRWKYPLYWFEEDNVLFEYTLQGPRPLDLDAPLCHVSAYEADAFARWKGARLPTEQEWEFAASDLPVSGNFLSSGYFHPTRDDEERFSGLYGDVWEWTSSSYSPYPGFSPFEGSLGEYNGKFMSSQLVLRGGSCVSSHDHIRKTYRNFFYPRDRWQFSGIRLAKDSL